jgi:hypothetical protein
MREERYECILGCIGTGFVVLFYGELDVRNLDTDPTLLTITSQCHNY